MQMTMRWFGAEKDTVTLEQIRQVPGVTGVVPALHDLPAGEAWPLDRILKMKAEIEAAGLTMECIESVNVHEDIKLGAPSAERYIENYKTSIRNLARAGVKVICYNFMPIFDWTRTNLAMRMGDGATCLSYDGAQIEGKSPEDMFREIDENSNGYAMPGWETERMGEIKDLFQKYGVIVSAKPEQRRLLELVNEAYGLGLEIPDTLKLARLSEKNRRLVLISVQGLKRVNGSLLPSYSEEEFQEATFEFVKYYVQSRHYDDLVAENNKLKSDLESEIAWRTRTTADE